MSATHGGLICPLSIARQFRADKTTTEPCLGRPNKQPLRRTATEKHETSGKPALLGQSILTAFRVAAAHALNEITTSSLMSYLLRWLGTKALHPHDFSS